MYKQYLKNILLFIVIFSIPIGGNWLFLLNSGELLPINEIADKQLSLNKTCLVGLATRNQGYYYKKEMYLRVKPEVFVHGSSRVMQFKKEHFSHLMFNAGGAMGHVNEGYAFVKQVFPLHKPKIMIIGIDYWWFNKSLVEPVDEIKAPLELSHRISFRSYLLPYKWLWQKKISFSDYFSIMNPLNYLHRSFDKGIGVDGILNRNGFAQDGSYFYTKIVTGQEQCTDERFKQNLELIKINGPRFEKDAYVHETHFQNFLNMLAFLKEQNVKVILFIPPIAPTLISELKHFRLIEELRQKLDYAGISYYDFHDASNLKANDCEFIDGVHGGDVLYARVLEYIAKHEVALQPYLDHAYLKAVSTQYSHLAMVPRPELTQEPEVDFLHLGCDKTNQQLAMQQ